MNKILEVINFEIKDINEEDRSFLAVGSTEAMDRHGENVIQDWELDNFKKNPVLPWGHDYYNPPMAKCTEIGIIEENGQRKLIFRAKFPSIAELSSDPSNPSNYALFVDSLYHAYKNSYIRAWSVGFISKKMEGTKHMLNELLEISGVTIPSNPEAMTLAYKDGVIDKKHVEASISCMKKSIESLTKSITVEEDIDMEELKKVQEELASLKELLTPELVEQLKALGDLDVAKLKAVTEKALEDGSEEGSEGNKDEDANKDDESEGAGSGDQVEVTQEELNEAHLKGMQEAEAEAKAQAKRDAGQID